MRIIDKQTFLQKPAAIYAAFTDKAFIEKKMLALGARNISIDISQEVDIIKVSTQREIPIEVPGRLSSFIQPWNKVSQTEEWRGEAGGPYYGTIEIDFPNAPVNVKGQMKIVATETGSTAASITDISCSVPFFGRLVTSLLSEVSEKALQEEMAYIREHA